LANYVRTVSTCSKVISRPSAQMAAKTDSPRRARSRYHRLVISSVPGSKGDPALLVQGLGYAQKTCCLGVLSLRRLDNRHLFQAEGLRPVIQGCIGY